MIQTRHPLPFLLGGALLLCALTPASGSAGLRQALRDKAAQGGDVERILHESYPQWADQADALSPDMARYLVLKKAGSPIPADLQARLFRTAPSGERQGGDTPAEAVPVGAFPYNDTGTTVGYTDEFGTTFGSPDVFYSMTVTEMTFITISLCGGTDYDSALQVFEDADGALGTSLYFIDDYCGLQSQLTEISLSPGSYFLAVDGFSSGSSGNYTLDITEVGNPCESYNDAVLHDTAPCTFSGTTVGATDIYSGDGGDAGMEVTIPTAGHWDFDACFPGTGYNAALYLFTTNPCEGGTLIASSISSNCTAPWGAGRLMEVNLEPGTYHLMASNTWTTTGTFEIHVQETPPRPNQGGPDEMGYVWMNNENPSGPEFDWVEINATGTNAGLTDDSYTAAVPLGLEFPFYESTYNQVFICSNGYLDFTQGYTSYSVEPFPTPGNGWSPDNFVAPFWDDMNPGMGGAVYYLSDPANDRFIVEWDHVPAYSGNVPMTFEIILYGSGDVLMQYLDMDEGDLLNLGVGQENTDGTIGLQVNYHGDGGSIGDGVAVYIDALEGDFRPPVITLGTMPTDTETELPGNYAVTATITDETGVASATVNYSVNGGNTSAVPMTQGANNVWSAAIPHQAANSSVSWSITAVDAMPEGNTRVSPAQQFDVLTFHNPPLNLSASDGSQAGTTITWQPPAGVGLMTWFGPQIPRSQDEAIRRLMAEHGMDKAAAFALWHQLLDEGARVFTDYKLYRDGELLAETTGTTFTDNASQGSEADVVYTYTVTAVYTAGESEPSNADTGYWGSAPTFGGPDAFGYIWRNSQGAGGPAYQWVDISGVGTSVPWAGSTDDGYSSALELGFSFPYYDQFVTQCYVGTNGYVSFTQGYSSLGSQPFPSPPDGYNPDNFVAAFWDDLYPGQGGQVLYYADAANQRFIVSFIGVPPYGGGSPYTFQFILSASGIITVNYNDMNESDLQWASAGMENSTGTIGLQYYYHGDGAAVGDQIAVSYLPPSNCEPVECTGIVETEPNEGWNDNNTSWNVIRCGDTRCGTILANGTTTDTDWYLYTHFGGDITVTLDVSDFNGRVSLRQQALNGQTVIAANTFPRCFDEGFTVHDLASGAYYIVVEHTGTPDVTEPQSYNLSLVCSGDPCSGHQPIECTGTPEAEPNEGWNAVPPNASYGEIVENQTICGSVTAAGGVRDMDWFHFHQTATGSVSFSAVVDAFDAALFLTQFDPAGTVLAQVNDAPACAPETLTIPNLPVGDYFIVIGHSTFEGVPVPQAYALTFGQAGQPEDPCTNYVDLGNFHDIWQAARPAPLNTHHDGTGCPGGLSTPGRDEVIRLVLTQTTDLQVTMQGTGMADEAILLLGNCAQPESSCGAAINAHGPDEGSEVLTLQNVPAGDYFVVADYVGAGETHPYSIAIADLNSGLANGQPLSFALEACHPNPFNPTTTIAWTQPGLAAATLTVHDLRGAVVEELDLGVRGAGRHSYVWDASRLGSGVYFYTLKSGDFQQTRKAVLVK